LAARCWESLVMWSDPFEPVTGQRAEGSTPSGVGFTNLLSRRSASGFEGIGAFGLCRDRFGISSGDVFGLPDIVVSRTLALAAA
jgi:hypothetical protein